MREKYKRLICKRCGNTVDRISKWDRPLRFCSLCVRLNRIDKDKKYWRKKHPKKIRKEDKVLSLLKNRPMPISELLNKSNIKNRKALRATISKLRSKGYMIKTKRIFPAHYILQSTDQKQNPHP